MCIVRQTSQSPIGMTLKIVWIWHSKGQQTATVVTGDFNVDYSKPIPNDSPNYLQHILTRFNLVNYVTSPTRVTASSASLIDLFLSTCPIDGTCETVYVDISDHYAVLSHLTFGVAQRTAPTCKPTRRLYRVNWDNFSTDLQNQQQSFPDDDSIDGMVNHYTTSILSTLEKTCTVGLPTKMSASSLSVAY